MIPDNSPSEESIDSQYVAGDKCRPHSPDTIPIKRAKLNHVSKWTLVRTFIDSTISLGNPSPDNTSPGDPPP
jgi:hypothetical protein